MEVSRLLDSATETALATIVTSLHRELGDLFVGAYLEGSFAWGNPVTTSDLDLRVVTAVLPSDAQRTRIDAIKAEATIALGREVGITVDTTDNLLRVGAVRFQRSCHLAGQDIRSIVPLKPIAVFAQDSLATARELVLGLRKLHGSSREFPVGPPQPTSEFRGYEIQRVLDQGSWIPSSKRLVTNVLAVATARVALDGGAYVLTKADVPGIYAEVVGDHWSAFVDEVYRVCRTTWAYRLPDEQRSREKLTALCDLAVSFENTLADR